MITEGALMLAIFTILLLISLYVPLLWAISSLFLILPFLIYSAKYPVNYSVLLIVISTALSGLVGGILTIPLALSNSTTGVVMGSLIKKRKEKFVIYVAGSFTFLLNVLLQYVAAIMLFDFNFMSELNRTLKSSFKESTALMEKLGQTIPENTEEQLMASVDMFQTLMPSLIVLFSFLSVLILILVNFPILKRLGMDVPVFEPFRNWQLPKSILWYYLFLLLGAFIAFPEKGTMWYSAYTNLMFMLQLCLLIQGLSFIFFYAYLKKWTKAIPIFIAVFSILMLPLLYLVRLLGIIDLGFDLRQRLQSKK